MFSSVGLRVYKLQVRKARDKNPISLNASSDPAGMQSFFRDFINMQSQKVATSGVARRWYFEPAKSNDKSLLHGLIYYGDYGFASTFLNRKSNEIKFNRQIDDMEVIPLYYRFWLPDRGNFALAGFQSYKGKSCISSILSAAKQEYSRPRKGYILEERKLMPASSRELENAPVKEVILSTFTTPSDLSDQYIGRGRSQDAAIELRIMAHKKERFGTLKELKARSSRSDKSILQYKGVEFEQARAKVDVGGKDRVVGVLGFSTDAGVIDLSRDVDYDPNGHPKFESISKEVASIFVDFHKTLTSR